MSSASAVTMLAAELAMLPLVIVSVRLPMLSRIALPFPALLPVSTLICWMVPLFTMLELPFTVMATLLPVTDNVPFTVPVPEVIVWAEVLVPVIGFGPGENWPNAACVAARRARALRRAEFLWVNMWSRFSEGRLAVACCP